MAYCRFSSNDHQCDFYAYESDNGFVLHLAANRSIWDPPNNAYNVEVVMNTPWEQWGDMAQEYHKSLMNAPREKIEHENAGETFTYNTLHELKDGISSFIEQGFIAPDWLIPLIDEEINEKANSNRA